MAKSCIHPTAIINDGAVLGSGVIVEAYAVIGDRAIIGDGATIKSHAYIDGNTTIGSGSIIYPCVIIGTEAQDKKFRGETTHVKIGKNCSIREFTTINSSCGDGSSVEIGDNVLIMATCHVAHNCKIGNGVTMANGVGIAGHVTIEDHANIGGMVGIKQRIKIGMYAMVGGFSAVSSHVPPFSICHGYPCKLQSSNIIGLRRHKFPREKRIEIDRALSSIYEKDTHLEDGLAPLATQAEACPYIRHLVDFIKNSKGNIVEAHKKKCKNLRLANTKNVL